MIKILFLILLLVGNLYGQARESDGDDDYMVLANESNFDFEYTDAFSFTFWLYLGSVDTAATIFDKIPDEGWIVRTGANDSGELNLLFYMKSDTADRCYAYGDYDMTAEVGAWHFKAITYNGGGNYTDVKFYHDAVLDTSKYATHDDISDGTMVNNNSVQLFDWNTLAGTYNLDGRLDEAKIFDYCLSAEEVESLMDKSFPGEKDNLILNLLFDEETGNPRDFSGLRNDVIITVGTLSVDNAPVKRIVGD